MKIFILEDERDFREIFKDNLATTDFIPIFATDLSEAEKILKAENEDIEFAILDIRIIEETYGGLDFGEIMRVKYPKIPFIFISVLYNDLNTINEIKKRFPSNTPHFLPKETITNSEAFSNLIYNIFLNDNDNIDIIEAENAEGVFLKIGEDDWKTFVKFSDILYLEADDKYTKIHLFKGFVDSLDDKLKLKCNLDNFEQEDLYAISFKRHIGKIAPIFEKNCLFFRSIKGKGKHYHFCINIKRLKKFRIIARSKKSELGFESRDSSITFSLSETISFKKLGLVLNAAN